jgi:hypothetical protein
VGAFDGPFVGEAVGDTESSKEGPGLTVGAGGGVGVTTTYSSAVIENPSISWTMALT